eukprot:symbB.v1.2.007554.t2/scaffold432.1/size246310/4
MDQGWGNTGDSGLLVYLRRADDSDEALMSITYDRRRSSRHQHEAVSEVPRGPYAPESGDCFHVVLRCPNYPGWSAYCKDVKLAVDCEEQVEEELSWSVSNWWQDQQEKAFFRLWAALAQDDYLTLDLSHLSLAGQQRQHVWNVVETDTGATPPRSLIPRFEALLRKSPLKNTETRERALRLLQKLQSNEQVMGAPTQAHERSRRYAELVALVHRTFDRLESGNERNSEMFEAVMQQYADCVDDCIYRWEREIHNMHDLVTGDVTGEGALEAEDEVLRVLYRYRRQMAEGVLHHTKGSNDMADMHFESHFYASVHFGLAEQRTARKDPHRLTYLSLNNRVRPEDLQAQLFKEYVPAKLRQILREEIFESKGSGTQALREKMTNWLSAHIPHAFRPSEGVEQRREAWLYQWCHDEEFRITNEALNYMLCCMHILSAVPLILQAGGHDVGAADVLPHGVAYVGPAAAAAAPTPAVHNASRSSPRTGGAGCEPEGKWKRPEIMDRLLEMSECLDRTLRNATGRLFLLSAPDLLEDLCSYVFLSFAWPKICYMQDIVQQDELKERVLKDSEKNDISEWSHVLRRILPMLLRTLEKVKTVDALTLCSAGDALAQLFLQENDSKSAQRELGYAILRLERELGAPSGPQARLDPPIASALSFDPPSLRPPNFALFQADQGLPPENDVPPPESRPASPASPSSRVSKAVSEKGSPRSAVDPDAAVILHALPRSQQDRLCLLGRLYERWIDYSLLAHLPHPAAPVRRKPGAPGTVEEEEVIQVAGESTSTRLALSSQEARVLGRLGENPYLRCFFFVSVAKRRPEVSSAALGKAVMEAEAAAAQERNLWLEQEKELLRQQKAIRNNEQFGKEYRSQKTLRKPPAHLPLVVARMPGRVQLRLPPLHRAPPMWPIAEDLNPDKQARKKMNANTHGMVFGKAAGVGTSVSDMHRDLLGTGCRRAGQDLVEIVGLKPNTNYCFATMYFDGWEESKGGVSSVSATSSPIGAYYPLPLALLRIKLCTAALGANDFGAHAWKKAWPPLFETFCERCAPEEEFDSYGLRSFKLRLDVADRFPPAILTAFAQLVLLRHRLNVSKASVMPCTKPAQRATLGAANECVIAVDCARRAGNGFLCRQAVSMTLELIARLLCYRSRPAVLLTLLAKCATSLEQFPKPERQLPWHSKARQTVMYLLHQTTVTCVQLRQVSLLQKELTDDVSERYIANPLADSEEVERLRVLLLDQALELALLGADHWIFAEKKAMVALQDSADKDELIRLLKELSNQNFAMAKDAAALALREEPERPLFALSLLRCAAVRSDQPDTVASVANVLSSHRCSQALDEVLQKRQQDCR